MRGTLRPHVATDGQGVEFRDAGDATVLTYAGLKVWDANGKVLASRFVPAENGLRLLVEEHGARYPLTIVGAHQESSSTTGINSVPNEAALGAGAAYVFVIPPTVTGISPLVGPTTGGTSVLINGTFGGVTVTGVSLGGAPATSVNVVDATSLTATTGAHAPGLVMWKYIPRLAPASARIFFPM